MSNIFIQSAYSVFKYHHTNDVMTKFITRDKDLKIEIHKIIYNNVCNSIINSYNEFIINYIVNHDTRALSIFEILEMSYRCNYIDQIQDIWRLLRKVFNISYDKISVGLYTIDDMNFVNDKIQKKCKELCRYDEVHMSIRESLHYLVCKDLTNIIFDYIYIKIPLFKALS